MRDITDQLQAKLARPDVEATEWIRGLSPCAHPQAALMFAELSAYQAHLLESDSQFFPDFDHALNLKTLAVCLARHVDKAVIQSSEEPRIPDHKVKSLWTMQRMEELNRHQAACIIQGLRRIWYDPVADIGRLSITKRRRLSALYLLNNAAQLQKLRTVTHDPYRPPDNTDDETFFAFASSIEHLHYVERADPEGWEKFSAAVGFTFDQLTTYSAFLVFLEFAANEVGHSLRYDDVKLVRLYDIFKLAFPMVTVPPETLLHLVKLFSLSPEESEQYLLPTPFFKADGYYLRARGFEHILSPVMGLLTIAIRKNEDAWSRTLGSTLARAADVIAESLPGFPNIRVAARRRLGRAGDIDLALYDVNTNHMLVCELKTVYDKHRTVIHMHRFEQAKVKLELAVKQLRTAMETIGSGAADLRYIFGQVLPPPRSITGALLTWLDPIDLTVGTPDEDILSLNFATFEYLVRRCRGDLKALSDSVRELRNVWCGAKLRPIDLHTDFPICIEVQVPVLDSKADLAAVRLSALSTELLNELECLPEGWPEDPNLRNRFVSYLADTLDVLGTRSGRSSADT